MNGMQMIEKKARELYVGNLQAGLCNAQALRDLFTPACAMLPEYNVAFGPAILSVDVRGGGTFAFVEFQNERMATAALGIFDKMEVGGRAINVGRPSGYQGATPNEANNYGIVRPDSCATPQSTNGTPHRADSFHQPMTPPAPQFDANGFPMMQGFQMMPDPNQPMQFDPNMVAPMSMPALEGGFPNFDPSMQFQNGTQTPPQMDPSQMGQFMPHDMSQMTPMHQQMNPDGTVAFVQDPNMMMMQQPMPGIDPNGAMTPQHMGMPGDMSGQLTPQQSYDPSGTPHQQFQIPPQ
jgi:hypothetical protein